MKLALLSLLLAALTVPTTRAVVLTVSPSADTTLFQTTPNNSLGNSTLAIGVTEAGFLSRGLLRFELSPTLSFPAEILSATLTIFATRAPHRGSIASTVGLHQALVSWQEGSGAETTGQPAQTGDATWNNRAHGQAAWGQPGGQPGVDFATTASTSAPMNALGAVTFASTPSFVSMVQTWVNNPASNFGFFLIPSNEMTSGSARRIASTEDFTQGLSPVPVQPPMLTITYTPIPEPSAAALIVAAWGLALLLRRRAFRFP